MDRLGADFEMSVRSIKEKLHANGVPVQIPWGVEDQHQGVIDLVRMKGITFDESELGSRFELVDIPQALLEPAKAARAHLIEACAEQDDHVMQLYLDGKEPSEAELLAALRKGCIARKLFPVLCGSAFKHKGVQPLLDAVVDFLPSPLDIPPVHGKDPKTGADITRETNDTAPFSALAFKIMTDPFVGTLTFIRVYSGRLETGMAAWNPAKRKRERIGRLVQMRADKRDEIDEVLAGDIAACVGLKLTTTGDTLCDEHQPIVLERMEFPDPVIDIAIEPKTKADQDRLGTSLQKLATEDPSFRVRTDPESGQTLIAGMGELHLEIIVDRLLREFKVEANVGKPQVAYRETITQPVEARGRYIRQSGGRGQYGDIVLRLSPNESGKGFRSKSSIVGGKVPKEFVEAAFQGAEEAMSSGPLAGYPMVDVAVEAIDGSFHDVDSNEVSFRIAGSMAVREGAPEAGPVLLEPVMSIEVVTPEEFMGDVIGDLNARRGKVVGMEPKSGAQHIQGQVPLATMFGYATDLRSRTQGRATYTMQFSHYAAVPKQVADEIIARIRGH